MRIACLGALSFILLTAAEPSLVAQTPPPACHLPLQSKQVAELLFGREAGVSDAAWARFVTRELTPRFPDGLTVNDASGQWRDPTSGRVVREPAKQVEIVLP